MAAAANSPTAWPDQLGADRRGIDLRDASLPASLVAAALHLEPHPEGGRYRELWRGGATADDRLAASSILFLLGAGERSHWHRVDASELWLWQAGAPLDLDIWDDGRAVSLQLGSRTGAGEMLQGIVPPFAWQAARSRGAWTLVSCIVTPAFQFEGFEIAPTDWSPPGWASDQPL